MCKFCVLFALLPAQCKSCDVFAQCTASAVCRAGATTTPLIIILFCYCFALLPAQCAVHVFPMLYFALLPVQCAVCVSPVMCLFNVLPAQFAVRGLRQVLLLLFNFTIFIIFTHSH